MKFFLSSTTPPHTFLSNDGQAASGGSVVYGKDGETNPGMAVVEIVQQGFIVLEIFFHFLLNEVQHRRKRKSWERGWWGGVEGEWIFLLIWL